MSSDLLEDAGVWEEVSNKNTITLSEDEQLSAATLNQAVNYITSAFKHGITLFILCVINNFLCSRIIHEDCNT
jgi:t-SNARE complex subunit (syntaxin)